MPKFGKFGRKTQLRKTQLRYANEPRPVLQLLLENNRAYCAEEIQYVSSIYIYFKATIFVMQF